MDAVTLLRRQRREVEQLFHAFGKSRDLLEKQQIFTQIADALHVHGAIGEQLFHPAIFIEETEVPLAEVFDAQIRVKERLIEAVVAMGSESFDAKVEAIRRAVEAQAFEEEHRLFRRVLAIVDAGALEALGQQMEIEAAVLIAKCHSQRSARRAALN